MSEETDKPLVTFAIFAYNQEKYIREAIEGAFAQTYEPLEIILSDDCSTDRTSEIMKEMSCKYHGPHKVVVRKAPKNLGIADHINSVLAASSGSIITWAAGDDVAEPERTVELVLPMLLDSTIIGTHSTVREISVNGDVLCVREITDTERNINLEIVVRHGISLVTQSHAFRRHAFDFFGPFRSELTQEGIAMAFRESFLGKVVYINKPLTRYRIGSGTSTYDGADLIRLKYQEPIKVTGWYMTAFQQMQDDSKMLNDGHINFIRCISENITFYSNLMKVNKREQIFASLLANFISNPKDNRTLKAVFRVLLPDYIYKFLMMPCNLDKPKGRVN